MSFSVYFIELKYKDGAKMFKILTNVEEIIGRLGA